MPEALKHSVQACDTAAINAFGEQAQAEVARYADSILRQVKGREAGDAGQLITELMLKAKGLDAADLQSAGLFSKLLGGVQRQVARFRARFETVADQIDEISGQLGLRVDRMRQDLGALLAAQDLQDRTQGVERLEKRVLYAPAGPARSPCSSFPRSGWSRTGTQRSWRC